jgi:hypothetical protein
MAQHIGSQIDAATILTWTDFVDVRVIFHGRFLRSHEFSMQNSATARKRNAFGLTIFVLVE